MLSIPAYYDGKYIQPLEPIAAQPNQRLIITVMDEFLDIAQNPINDITNEKPRIGAAKGKFKAPDDIDFCNDEIADLFYGEEK